MPPPGKQVPCAGCGLENSGLALRCQRCGHGLVRGAAAADPAPAAALFAPAAAAVATTSGPVACPACGRNNSRLARRCQSCGAGLDTAAPAPAPPAQPAPPAGSRTMVVNVLPQGTSFRQTLGRTPDNDVALPHPQVSGHHAVLVGDPSGLTLEDLGSSNGTFVRGQRLTPGAPVRVSPLERVYIGPWPIVLGAPGAAPAAVASPAADRWPGCPLYEVEAWGLTLQVPDRDNPAQQKTILDDVSFKALPGDMIALMGPSGAGKTTLLLALNGYLPPSAGQIRVNGEDLYAIYDNLRGIIGYVPQDDIVHPELTVFEAVRYSARFRLPPDTSDAEIDRRVEATLAEIGLTNVRNLQIGKPEKKVLSGGQRKRVNIAMELVTDPVILFLDEPTSGLAADDTTSLIRSLSQLTARSGKTVIMTIHQPAKDEFELFNLVLLMGPGGIPMFYGPTSPDAYDFFGAPGRAEGKAPITNPRDLFEAIAQREKRVQKDLAARGGAASVADAKQQSARLWHDDFYRSGNAVQRAMYSGERRVGEAPTPRGARPGPPSTRGQLRLLISRYVVVKRADVVGSAIMLLQAPIIGILLAIVFGLSRRNPVNWCTPGLPGAAATAPDNAASAFFLVVTAVWFGTSNAAREIVSERAIYLRERMVNLGLVNYVASKYLVLSLLCVVQCAVLLFIVSLGLGFHGGVGTFLLELGILVATSMNAVALGLLLSTVVTSAEAAMALTPIVLIPQVVLGGFVVHMSDSSKLAFVMNGIPARWGFHGLLTLERAAISECASKTVISDAFPVGVGLTEVAAVTPVLVLAAETVMMVIILLALLKRRDPI